MLTASALAQRGGPPPTPKAQAAFDITGYWVAVVNEDWRSAFDAETDGWNGERSRRSLVT
jgi:hypothetical protein